MTATLLKDLTENNSGQPRNLERRMQLRMQLSGLSEPKEIPLFCEKAVRDKFVRRHFYSATCLPALPFDLAWIVRVPANSNPGWKVHRSLIFSSIEMFFVNSMLMFCVLFEIIPNQN